MLLLPRLATPLARAVYEDLKELSPEEAQARAAETDYYGEMIRFASVGGQRRGHEGQITELRTELLAIACSHGYPQKLGKDDQRSFDLAALRYLHDWMVRAVPGECVRVEPWQYLTCAQLPGVVIWRFPGQKNGPTSEDRFVGWVRNALGRLWWRAELLKDDTATDPYWLLDQSAGGLNEDNLVALLERPWTGGHKGLNRAIARAYIERRDDVAGLRRPPSIPESQRWTPTELLMRDAMKRVIRLSAYVSWNAMTDDQLISVARDTMGRSVYALTFQAGEPMARR